MGFLAQLIGEIVKGLLGEFLKFWATKQSGKKEQALADLTATVDLERQMVDARDAIITASVTDDWLRHGGGTAPSTDPASAHPTSAD